ncbi:hypothetical protein LTR36_002574 [Oleoguttula mirabilis]|uniref:Cytochrome P450 n=1 Tax=Oleoguttula mirabilis TaxID=1507867 RepID=A0AAV9JMA2_9PEZI|nr:hypothetical protein LTR36_002574 [Oleoguttula mirabilis]
MFFSVLIPVMAGVLVLYAVKWWFLDSRVGATPLPPGPPGLPLVGNLNDLPPPTKPEYQHWLEHKDRYGPLSSITVLGQTMVIIHDKEVAFELMEKRANKYSGRPKLKFGFDMVGWGDGMSQLPYNHTLRLHRKYVYQQLGSKATVSKYYALQETAVGRFLWRLKGDKGDHLVDHLNTEAAEVILDIVYGYTIEPHGKDPLVALIDQAMEEFSAAIVPGKWLVDILPFLEHIPEWMPGAGFKRIARAYRRTAMDVVNVPYAFAKAQMASGKQITSFVSKSIEQARQEKDFGSEEDHAIKWSAVSMYTGGADTSVSTMVAFFLAMSLFPDVQRKAQEEIDRVVGTSRLPTFNDRQDLPYINAVVEEAQRWHPVGPMGIPHAADEEDTINGYRMSKGALLLPAIWWFTRDPATYHDPESFKPERFLEPYNEPSATNVIFGFGRRICPGKALADATMYLTFVQSLAAFDVRKALDDRGEAIVPEHKFDSGIIAHPGPFGVSVVPRSRQHEILIEKVVEEHPWKESDAKYLRGMQSISQA